MSHTRGPWRCYIDVDGGGTFAVAIEKHDSSWPLPLSVENAALIAAAPDLLMSLKAVLAEIEACLGIAKEQIREAVGSTNLAVLAVKCQRAESAIAKAEGR